MNKKQNRTKKQLKEIVISIRMTENEVIELNRLSNKTGIKNRTDYIKSCIFKDSVVEGKPIEELIKSWNKIDKMLSKIKKETLNIKANKINTKE